MRKAPLLVAAALIRKADKILLAQRKWDDINGPGKWEFPGGKVDFGEHPEECIRREIKEELNIDIKVDSLFGLSSHIYKSNSKEVHIILLCYLCGYISGELKCLDAEDAKWVDPSEIAKFDLADADKPLLPLIAQKFHGA